MQSINLSKKSPINISIFTSSLDDSIFEDIRFIQLMDILAKSENLDKYTYCFYCDTSMIKGNVFIPIFHTMYLSCKINNVLIKDKSDLWITNLFKHNKYYIIVDDQNNFDYSDYNVIKINHIKEIDGVLA